MQLLLGLFKQNSTDRTRQRHCNSVTCPCLLELFTLLIIEQKNQEWLTQIIQRLDLLRRLFKNRGTISVPITTYVQMPGLD